MIKLNMIETRLKPLTQNSFLEIANVNESILNICIDLDGTVTEPYYWLRWANDYFQRDILPKDVTIYQIHTLLEIEEAEYLRFYDLYGEWMHLASGMREGADAVIRDLHKNHRIHFVTARAEKMRDVSLAWLRSYQIPLHSIHYLGGPDKVNKARDLACDLFIEDSYANAVQLAAAGFLVVLINCSYNQGPLPGRVIRVQGWMQIDSIVAHLVGTRLTRTLHQIDADLIEAKITS
jgi:uncharacterized protein